MRSGSLFFSFHLVFLSPQLERHWSLSCPSLRACSSAFACAHMCFASTFPSRMVAVSPPSLGRVHVSHREPFCLLCTGMERTYDYEAPSSEAPHTLLRYHHGLLMTYLLGCYRSISFWSQVLARAKCKLLLWSCNWHLSHFSFWAFGMVRPLTCFACLCLGIFHLGLRVVWGFQIERAISRVCVCVSNSVRRVAFSKTTGLASKRSYRQRF